MAELLIENGADVNIKDNKGQIPLHKFSTAKNSASSRQKLFIVAQLLIEKGADVNAKDNQGKTPLLDNVNAKDNEGKTPLPDNVDDDDKERIVSLRANDGRTTSFLKKLKAFFLQFVFW